jgi:hypothetical protein
VFGRRKRGDAGGQRGGPGGALPDDPADLLAVADRLRLLAAGDADPALLVRALAAAKAAADANRDDPDARAVALSMMCVLYRTQAARAGGTGSLRSAIQAGREGYALAARTGSEVGGRCASALATTLIDLYQSNHEAAAIDEAVELSRQAVDGLDPDHEEYVGMLSNLGNALLLASQAHESSDLLNESIAASRLAMRAIGPTHDRFVNVSVNLASALFRQALTTMSVTSVRETQALLQAALRKMRPGDPNRPAVLGFAAQVDRAVSILDR